MTEPVPAYGEMVNSGNLTGTPAERPFQRQHELLEKKGVGKSIRQLPNTRLADLTTALLGCADSDHFLRKMR